MSAVSTAGRGSAGDSPVISLCKAVTAFSGRAPHPDGLAGAALSTAWVAADCPRLAGAGSAEADSGWMGQPDGALSSTLPLPGASVTNIVTKRATKVTRT